MQCLMAIASPMERNRVAGAGRARNAHMDGTFLITTGNTDTALTAVRRWWRNEENHRRHLAAAVPRVLRILIGG